MSMRSYQSRTPELAGCVGKDMARLQMIMSSQSVLRLRIVSPQNWVNAKTVAHCSFCTRKFRPFSRKHHCRACGNVICHHCNRECDVQVGPTIIDRIHVRVCFGCIDHELRQDDEPAQDEYSAWSEHVPKTQQNDETSSAYDMTSNYDANSNYDARSQYARSEGSYYRRDTAGSESPYSRQSPSPFHRPTRSPFSLATPSPFNRPEREQRATGRGLSEDWIMEQPDEDEEMRQHLLETYHVIEDGREAEYNALCDLVCRSLDCNVGAVAFLTASAQWYKAKRGISQAELPREVAFCSKLLQEPGPTVVLDASKDDRFRRNPLVVGSAHIRYFASAHIRDPVTKVVLGSVFVMDTKPKNDDPTKTIAILRYLARTAERLVVGGRETPERPAPPTSAGSIPRTRSSSNPQPMIPPPVLDRSSSDRWEPHQQHQKHRNRERLLSANSCSALSSEFRSHRSFQESAQPTAPSPAPVRQSTPVFFQQQQQQQQQYQQHQSSMPRQSSSQPRPQPFDVRPQQQSFDVRPQQQPIDLRPQQQQAPIQLLDSRQQQLYQQQQQQQRPQTSSTYVPARPQSVISFTQHGGVRSTISGTSSFNLPSTNRSTISGAAFKQLGANRTVFSGTSSFKQPKSRMQYTTQTRTQPPVFFHHQQQQYQRQASPAAVDQIPSSSMEPGLDPRQSETGRKSEAEICQSLIDQITTTQEILAKIEAGTPRPEKGDSSGFLADYSDQDEIDL